MRQTALTGEVAPQGPRGRGIPQGYGHFVNSPHWHVMPIDHMQISAPFRSGCRRHIERSFARSEPHSIQLLLHCCVSEFWSHCKVLQELGDSRLSFLRRMVESIDSHGAEQEEVGFHRNFAGFHSCSS